MRSNSKYVVRCRPGLEITATWLLLLIAGVRPGWAQSAALAEAQRTAEPPITAAAVKPHIEYLASPQLKGRSGADRLLAAKYLRDQFASIGLEPLFEDRSYFQPIPGGSSIQQAAAGETPIVGYNIGGWIPGSDESLRHEFVMITAHYDHLGIRRGEIHPGADDNASGVAMMLEVARELAQRNVKPRRSIVFVGFDLEEELLWGSRWFAAHPPWDLDRVKLFITADMVGRSLGDLPLPTVFVLGAEHAPKLQTILQETSVPAGLELARLGIDLIGTRSDYGPFRDRQIPFLFFSTGQHPDYHTPGDVPELVDCEKVARVGAVVLAVAVTVANANEPPEWTNSITPDLEEARAIHRITELMLDADASGAHSLNSVQRFFVSQVHAKTGNALKLGRLTAAERHWLTRSSKLLLLSVF